MKIVRNLILAFLLTTVMAMASDTWESTDGKTINADFIRMNGNSVVLEMRGRKYTVPIEKLSKESKNYALYLNEELNKWAAVNLKQPIISEEVLNDLIAYNPRLTEGKHFLVEGRVKSIRGHSSRLKQDSRPTATIRLEEGTSVTSDFAEQADGRRTKIEVESERVMLMKARTLSGGEGWKNFTPERSLVSVGETILLRAKVERGKIIATGLPSSQEIAQAQLEAARANGGLSTQQHGQLEKIKIRIEYLEAALSGNAGSSSFSGISGNDGSVTIGSATHNYSEAEKQAMRKELELLRAQLAAAASP